MERAFVLFENGSTRRACELAGDAQFVVVSIELVCSHGCFTQSRKETQRRKENLSASCLPFAPLREILRRLSDRGNGLIDIILRRANVCDTGAQRKMPVH